MPAMQQGFLILTPALTLTPALSQRERGIAELWGWELRVPSERPGLIGLTGATYPGSECRAEVCFRADWWRCLPVICTHALDSGLRRNDDWGAG